jgi:cobalt-zinc-cadmium efflux system protein
MTLASHNHSLGEPGTDRRHDAGHSGGGHNHTAGAPTRALLIVLALTIVFIAAEAIGGIAFNSLALLADAGHMVSDAAALALSLGAIYLASRPHTSQRTFGWHRAEILAAAINGIALLVISLAAC